VTLTSVSTRAFTTAAFATALLLTACAGATPTVVPSSSTSAAASPPAAATLFAGTGFRTNIPEGWQDETTNQGDIAALTGTGGGTGTILMLLVSPDQGILVARTTPQPVPDDQLAQYLSSTKAPGSTNVSTPEPVDVDGESGVLVTFDEVPASGAPLEVEDMVVNTAGNTYEIALSAAQSNFAGDAAGLQEILDSWSWA
jgi:hypothetical protein